MEVYFEIEDLMKEMVKIERLKDYKVDDIVEETKLDKKMRCGEAKYFLLKDIGRFCKKGGKFVHSVEEKQVLEALKYFS